MISFPPPFLFDRSFDRPPPAALADALAALEPLPAAADANALTSEHLRPVLYQWLATLDAADIGELAGLRDDLDGLARALESAVVADQRAALHRAGLSIERVAAWGRSAGLTDRLLALGRRLVALSEVPH